MAPELPASKETVSAVRKSAGLAEVMGAATATVGKNRAVCRLSKMLTSHAALHLISTGPA